MNKLTPKQACRCPRPGRPLYPNYRHVGELMIEFRCCQRCNGYASMGNSRDDVPVEIRAAMLDAGYETANDTDDVLDDPITKNVIDHYVGFDNLLPEAVEVHELAEVMREHAEVQP